MRDLAAHLTANGVPTWYDNEIESGAFFAEKISQAIESSAAIIVVLTPEAAASIWVNREIAHAEHLGKPIHVLRPGPTSWPACGVVPVDRPRVAAWWACLTQALAFDLPAADVRRLGQVRYAGTYLANGSTVGDGPGYEVLGGEDYARYCNTG